MNEISDNVFLFDMDGSLADHDSALLADLTAIMSPEEKMPPNLWDAERKHPYIQKRISLIRNQPGWWLNLKPLPHGMSMYRTAMQMGFVCEVLTKGPKTKTSAWKEKVDWCQKYLGPDVDVHIVSDNQRLETTGGKSRVYGRVLYDDYPAYMLKWLAHRPRGLGIMPITEYNKTFRHPQVLRYDGTEQTFRPIHVALKRVLARKNGEPLNLENLHDERVS